jgi:hypothetical protein
VFSYDLGETIPYRLRIRTNCIRSIGIVYHRNSSRPVVRDILNLKVRFL